jgi:enamine deaminase RidA (YjgF/YER057c/UK114 family)
MSGCSDGRRGFLGLTLLGVTGGALTGSVPSVAGADEQRSGKGPQGLFPEGAPAAAPGYSPGISVEGQRAVFVSGQGPADLKADLETQIRQTFERIGLVLRAGGASFRDVVMIRAYFTHLARDLPIYRKVRKEFLKEPYPAATAVGVIELAVPGLEVEIEAVAVV